MRMRPSNHQTEHPLRQTHQPPPPPSGSTGFPLPPHRTVTVARARAVIHAGRRLPHLLCRRRAPGVKGETAPRRGLLTPSPCRNALACVCQTGGRRRAAALRRLVRRRQRQWRRRGRAPHCPPTLRGAAAVRRGGCGLGVSPGRVDGLLRTRATPPTATAAAAAATHGNRAAVGHRRCASPAAAACP